MLAYKITINGVLLNTVGMKEDGLIWLKADWTRLKDAEGDIFPDEGHANFRVFGMRDKTEEHLEWHSQDLKPGDKITIELVETDVVDPPKEIRKSIKKKKN